MRIAHVTDCYLPRLGGIERQVHDLAAQQSAQGHEVHIITSVPGSAGMDWEFSGTVHRPHRSRIVRRGGETIRYATIRQGRAAVLAGKFDVVHAHASMWSPLAYSSAYAASARGIPAVITVHSLWDRSGWIYTGAEHTLHWSRWPVLWTAVSEAALVPLRRRLPVGAPVRVLHNAVDPSDWPPSTSVRDPKRVVAVSVMRLTPRKRPHDLIHLFERARAELSSDIRFELVIVGDGPQYESTARLVARAGLADVVRLPGRGTPAQVREVLEDADFYVAPAHLESFGIAALEARCTGLPVVAFEASGVRDFVRHEQEGLLAADDAGMAAAMARLAGDAELRERLMAHNRATAPKALWPDVLARCEQLYAEAETLLPGKRHPHAGVEGAG